jgi:predicted RNA-binding Zn ribbon-like protein
MSNEPTTTEQQPAPEGVKPEGEQGQTFTQADVERIVKDRLAQQAKNKFGDYDELKTKAGNALTLEQRIADMEAESAKAKAEALRARVAADFGISTKKGPKGEPSDADLFLTGADESTLTVQAQRLAAREEDRKKQGNFAPKEGTTTYSGNDNGDFRDVVKQLFASAD